MLLSKVKGLGWGCSSVVLASHTQGHGYNLQYHQTKMSWALKGASLGAGTDSDYQEP